MSTGAGAGACCLPATDSYDWIRVRTAVRVQAKGIIAIRRAHDGMRYESVPASDAQLVINL